MAAVDVPDPRANAALDSAVAAVSDVARRLADLRVHSAWAPNIQQLVEREQVALEGILEAAADPRFKLFFDAPSAEEFSRAANNLLGLFTAHPNDAPNIAPPAWSQLVTMGSIVRAAFIGNFRGSSRSAEITTEALVARTQSILRDLLDLEKEVKALASQYGEIQTSATKALGQIQHQFLTTQRGLESEWREALKSERDALSLEKDSFVAEVSRMKEQHSAELARFQKEHEAVLKELEKAKLESATRLADYDQQARSVLGAIGSTGQSSQYEQAAVAAGNRSAWWQGGAVALMVAAVALLVFFLWKDASFELNPGDIANGVKKLLLVGLLGILSRYCAAMADRARRERLWAQQRAVELRTLTAYLEPLPDADKQKMREKLIEKYFGVGSTLLVEAGAQDLPATATYDALGGALREVLGSDASSRVLSALLRNTEKRKKKKVAQDQ